MPIKINEELTFQIQSQKLDFSNPTHRKVVCWISIIPKVKLEKTHFMISTEKNQISLNFNYRR